MSNMILPNVTNTSSDEQLDKAFNDIVAQYEKTGTTALPTVSNNSVEDSFNDSKTDVSEANKTDESNVTANDNSQRDTNTEDNPLDNQPVGQQITDTNTPNPLGTSVESMDVQQLKEELHKRDMDLKLQRSRLADLSVMYQELKTQQEAMNKSASNSLDTTSTKASTHTEAVKELFEIYPEIAEAVSQMIEEKTKATMRNFEETLNNRVIPIQQHLQMNATQQFINKVLAAHPDAQQIVQSPALRAWVDSLDPIMRSGANTVMQYGNADEVISLISQYKSAKGISAPSSRNSMSSSSFNGNVARASSVNNNSSSLTAREDAIANKVLSMLNIPSTSQEPTIVQHNATPEYKNLEEAFEALCAQQEASYKR